MDNIEETNDVHGKELNFWNPKKLNDVCGWKEGWRFVLSERRIGKTTTASEWIYDRAMRGERTCLVRTKKTEIMGCAAGYADMINKYHPGEHFTARRNDLSADLIDSKGHLCAKCFALNTFSDARGGGLEADMLLQDEMIPEDRRYWVEDPYHALLSIHSSACNSEGLIWSFANRVSSVNPYFAKMRIYVKDDQDITVWKGIAGIEIARGYKTATPVNAPISGAWKAGNFEGLYQEEHDNLKDFIEKPRMGKWSGWTLVYGKHCYELLDTGTKCIWGLSREKGLNYVTNIKDLCKGRELMPPKIQKLLKSDFTTGRIRFESLNTMMDVVSALFENPCI